MHQGAWILGCSSCLDDLVGDYTQALADADRYKAALQKIIEHFDAQPKHHVCWLCDQIAKDALGGKPA